MKISTWIFAIKVFPEDTTVITDITDGQDLVLPFKKSFSLRGLHVDFPDQPLTGPGGTPSQYCGFREMGKKSVLFKNKHINSEPTSCFYFSP